jgi:hypothetical protein
MADGLDWSKRIVIPRERHPASCECKRCRKKRNASMPDPSLLTVAQTALMTGIPKTTVQGWSSLASPPIESIQFGRMVRYRRTDVAKFIKALRASGD